MRLSSRREKPRVLHGICSLLLLFSSFCMAEVPATLESLIASALQAHPGIQAQQARLQGAKADVDAADWQFFPTLSLAVEQANASASDSSYQGDKQVSTVRLQQPLWTGGRLTAGKDKAEAGVIVSRSSLAAVGQQLALQVVQAYSEWLAAHLKIQAQEKNLTTHNRLHERVSRRLEQGASSESDVVLAVGRLKSVVAELSLASMQRDIALARLGQLVGHEVDDFALSAAIAAPRPVSSDLQTLVGLALAVNPDIQKAQAQADVQEYVIAERKADLSPEVYVRAERQYGNYTYGDVPPENRVLIGFSSRFGAGLSSLSNIESAKSLQRAALAEVDVQKRLVTERVLADYSLAFSSQTRLSALRESLDAAGEVSNSYDRQFLAGRKSWLDVMNAARELAQTEVQLADIDAAQVVASWRLAIYTESLAGLGGSMQ